MEPIRAVLTEFGFVLARGAAPLVGRELARLPEDLRPDMSYSGPPAEAYHWSGRHRARRAAEWLTERGF